MARYTKKLLLAVLLVTMLISCKKDDEETPYLISIGGLIGNEVGIIGKSFDADIAQNRVFLGSSEANVISVEPTLITFVVPDVPVGDYPVTVFSGEAIYDIGAYRVLFPVDPITLVGYFPLNGTAFDLASPFEDGTESGDLVYANDRHNEAGRAANFDGVDDVITSPLTPDFQLRTISFWFYATNSVSTEKQVIISVDDDALQYGRIRAEIQSGTLTLWGAGLTRSFSMSIQSNRWYHIVMARDADLVAYFVNGAVVDFGEASGDGETVTPNPDLVLGAGPTTDSEFFQGSIDEVIIFNRVLTEEEIQILGEY